MPVKLPWQVGDRLWVREAWRPSYSAEGWREDLGRVARPIDFDPKTTAIEYLADDEHELNGKNRPGIHMPRWASRMFLTVTERRVQRLQEISETDAKAEGVSRPFGICDDDGTTFVDGYGSLWEEIHGLDSWDLNPWVCALTFTVEHRNIDADPPPATTNDRRG